MAFVAEEVEHPESHEKERFPHWGSGEGGEEQLFWFPTELQVGSQIHSGRLQAGGQEVQPHDRPPVFGADEATP